jgi:hypothetical protein
MPDVFIEDGVELAAVAKHLNSTVGEVEAECRALDIFVYAACNHRPAIRGSDAYELVSGTRRKNIEHQRAWNSYRDAAEEWTKQRNAAYMDATRTPNMSAEKCVAAGREAAGRVTVQVLARVS